MNQIIKTKAPAKINCFLRITGRLPNGYHTVYTLFRKITLWDRLTLIINGYTSSTYGVDVQVINNPSVPSGKDNLAHKAATRFFEKTGIRAGLKIVIEKIIPTGAGLGGGSSDASCVLKCLNQAFGRPIAQADLFHLAKSIGADCPFFIHEAPSCVATGIGDELVPVTLKKHYYLLILPDVHVSTKWAYDHFVLTKSDVEISFVPEKLDAFERWENDFEPIVFARFPELEAYKKELIENGAKIALMTGSGSAIYGLFGSRKEAESARAVIGAKLKGKKVRLIVAESL